MCTALLVNGRLRGGRIEWAITGAFGDNLDEPAQRLAEKSGLQASDIASLRELGVCINYNGYGPSLDDLHFHPDALYESLFEAEQPQAFLNSSTFRQLQQGYQQDLAASAALTPVVEELAFAVYQLPDAAWARRVSGVLGNELANRYPKCAHAIITAFPNQVDRFQISIRSPKNNPTGAHELARIFGGGGRKVAAGINDINRSELDNFWDEFKARYG